MLILFVAAIYMAAWGLAMETATVGFWPMTVAALLLMGALCFHSEIGRLRRTKG